MIEKNASSDIDWSDPDQAPEWTDDQFERAEFSMGDRVIRPANGTLTKAGRPRSLDPKRQVTLRLDSAVVERLRSDGPGWQTRANALLRSALGL